MKKSLVVVCVLSFILILSLLFVSAGWFGDFFGKITGSTTSDLSSSSVDKDCVQKCLDEKCFKYNRAFFKRICENKNTRDCWDECFVEEEIEEEAQECTDSDGLNYYNKGYVTVATSGGDEIFYDACVDGYYDLIEQSCEDSKRTEIEYHCSNGCEYGGCAGEITDVAVIELTIFPEIPKLGDRVDSTAIVQNIGNVGTNVSISSGYQGPMGGGGGGSAPRYLGPGETYTTHSRFFASYEGQYSVWARVSSEIEDINLSNNDMSLTFFIEGEEPSPLCGSTIYHDTILIEDILNCEGFGLIVGADGITLDCGGHIIDSTETFSANYGIFVYNKKGITIKNCIIQEFYEGLYLWSSFDNLFYNNNFIDNNVANAYEASGSVNNSWNTTDLGNYWDDFESNPGYPDYYEISGPGNGIDYLPLTYVEKGFTNKLKSFFKNIFE